MALLSISFFLLAINFFLFLLSGDKNKKLRETEQQLTPLSKYFDKVKEDYNEKITLLAILNWDGSRSTSYYLDRLALLRNESITFKQLVVNPVVLEKRKTSFKFDEKHIKLIGVYSNPVQLKDWITSIRNENWVIEIDNQRIWTDPISNQSFFSFTILFK